MTQEEEEEYEKAVEESLFRCVGQAGRLRVRAGEGMINHHRIDWLYLL